ncbi:unnamed protein product [Staurois parvus]|uniref:Uncharacterized protein n=1 Tax=Staurois parvus TaxID=386267 RepID=A0ABN9EWV4_9NEOB|nr:unnamed protein product [Staurois parvus]
MCRVIPQDMSYLEIRGGHWKKGRIREDRKKTPFLHNAEDYSLGFHSEYNKHALLLRGGLTSHGAPGQ